MSKPKSKPVSHQRLWQRQQVAAGLCSLCAKPLHTYAILCDEHQQAKRDQYARRVVARAEDARKAKRRARDARRKAA